MTNSEDTKEKKTVVRKPSPDELPPTPLLDATQQTWRTSCGLVVMLHVAHLDSEVEQHIGKLLGKDISVRLHAQLQYVDDDSNWELEYSTRGLKQLLKSMLRDNLKRRKEHDALKDRISDLADRLQNSSHDS